MADGLRFTDLTQLAGNNVNGQDITAVSHYNAGSYSSMSVQIQDLGRALLGNLSYTTELPNFGSQTVFGALLQLLSNFANVYNPANTYALNSCVIYQGILYKCTTAIVTPEAWDSTHWTAIKAVDVGSGGGGGGASALNDLSDVTITSATLANGQILKYDSSSHLWINTDPSGGTLSSLSDVSLLSLSNGQFLVYDSTSSKWVNKEVIHEPLTQAQYDAMVQAGTVDPNVYYPITDASIDAEDIDYDNTTSGLTAINVQGAIDEVNASIPLIIDGLMPVDSDSGAVILFNTELAKPLVNLKADIDYSSSGVSEVNIYQLSNNLFDKTAVDAGKLINGAGNEVAYTDWNISDFIPVVEGASYYLYGLTSHPNTQQDNFELFDENKTKTGFANVKTYEQPYTIPSGVTFIKFTVHDNDLNTAQFGISVNSTYEAYNAIKQTADISSYGVYGGYITITPTGATLTSTKNADGTDKATPDIYTLSGITSFVTLVGDNNMFADSGDIAVQFKDSIQHYIDKKIVETQALVLQGE